MTRVLVVGTGDPAVRELIRGLLQADFRVTMINLSDHEEQSCPSPEHADQYEAISWQHIDTTERLESEGIAASVVIQWLQSDAIDRADHSACTAEVLQTIRIICRVNKPLDHAITLRCLAPQSSALSEELGQEQPENYLDASQLACEHFWDLEGQHAGAVITRFRFAGLSDRSGSGEPAISDMVESVIDAIQSRTGGVMNLSVRS